MFSNPFPKWASLSNITAEALHCSGGGAPALDENFWDQRNLPRNVIFHGKLSRFVFLIDNWIITNLVMTSQDFLRQMTWCWQWTYHLKMKLQNTEADVQCKKLEKNWKFLELKSTEEVVKKLNKKRNLKKDARKGHCRC